MRDQRVIDPNIEFHKELNHQVFMYGVRKKFKSMHCFTQKFSICSQCKRPMQKHTADIQIENKRENAPICVACILGIKRTPKYRVKMRMKGNQKQRIEFNKRRREKYSNPVLK